MQTSIRLIGPAIGDCLGTCAYFPCANLALMHKFLLVALALVLSATGQTRSAARKASAPKPVRPDVILVTIDTLRADHVGCYGSKTARTPVLDQLCSSGIKAERAFTASTITNTSHASIFTGLYPSRHGVSDFAVPLSTQSSTLAEHLKNSGYRTAAFIGAVILDSSALAPGFNRGFDHYDNFPSASAGKSGRFDRVERRAETVVEHASLWLTKNIRGPRFVWVHLYDPHDPYAAPAPFSGKSAATAYDGEIAYTDSAVGKLFALLKRQNRYDNALVIVMSDHGEGLGEHDEDTHGIFLYDSTLRIPLIIKRPGNVGSGTILTQQVSSVDVLPTILELIGLPVPQDVDGKSFRTGVEGGKAPDHTVIAETDYPLRFGWAPIKAVRKNEQKYIDAPRPEFYELAHDPAEKQNQYQPWKNEVQSLRGELAEFRKNAPARPTTATAPVDPATIEELKALGYLGNDPGSTSVAEPSMLPDPKDKIQVQNFIHAGMMNEEEGAVTQARAAFAKAVELDPTSAVAASQLGTLDFKSGDFDGAARHLAKAYALRPDDPSVALMLGRSLERKGEAKAAKDVLVPALERSPGSYDARVALGRAYLKLGDETAAADQLEAAVFLDPNQTSARIELARLLLKQGKSAEAAEQIRRVESIEPQNPELKELQRSK